MATLTLLALTLCGLVSTAHAQAAGKPAQVKATPGFNPNDSGVYSTTAQNPNPAVKVEWKVMYNPPMNSVSAVESALIPGSDDIYMFVGRFESYKHEYKEYMASTVHLNTGAMRNITVGSNLFCGHISPTSDGKLLIVGGSGATPNRFTSGLNFLGVYDYQKSFTKLSRNATMAVGRWYPTATLMPDKTVLLQGGTKTASEFGPVSTIIERWSPANPSKSPPQAYPIEATYAKNMGKNFFPAQFVLPTGDVYIQQDNLIRFLQPNGQYRTVAGVPAFPVNVATQWPRSGTIVMGPLSYKDNYSSVEIIVLGGTPKSSPCTYGAPGSHVVASRKIYTLRMTWTMVNGQPKYSFPLGKWQEEDMGIPRTGGDGTLTPAGDVVLVSGSQRGCHGGSKNGWPRNTYPALWPILYQTDLAQGKRVTVMDATPIARVYHMTAALTRDGHIMVAGCDSCYPSRFFKAGIDPKTTQWWSPSITGRRDFRTETLRTPFSLDVNNRPEIVKIGGNTNDEAVVKAGYGDTITVTWKSHVAGAARVPVTSASLVAPSAATHSYNGNQRVVKLKVVSNDQATGTLTLQMPPNTKVAPPQMYMLFLLNQKTNSRGRWVHLE